MRRIFLVLAMLALLVLTAMPATAQSDWWDGGNDHSWWDGGNDHGDDDKDHGDDDKDHWWAPPSIWCGWFPSWWGWDLWCYSPWFGWWEAS
jgi:hypothetical protein